jgi:hypothetical protein
VFFLEKSLNIGTIDSWDNNGIDNDNNVNNNDNSNDNNNNNSFIYNDTMDSWDNNDIDIFTIIDKNDDNKINNNHNNNNNNNNNNYTIIPTPIYNMYQHADLQKLFAIERREASDRIMTLIKAHNENLKNAKEGYQI